MLQFFHAFCHVVLKDEFQESLLFGVEIGIDRHPCEISPFGSCHGWEQIGHIGEDVEEVALLRIDQLLHGQKFVVAEILLRQTFQQLGPQQCRTIALEIAMLGRNGLDINDPTDRYTLQALPGSFSGLHLLAIMYTAFRQIDPTMDTGADFGAEYQAALEMQNT